MSGRQAALLVPLKCYKNMCYLASARQDIWLCKLQESHICFIFVFFFRGISVSKPLTSMSTDPGWLKKIYDSMSSVGGSDGETGEIQK